jgi:transposase
MSAREAPAGGRPDRKRRRIWSAEEKRQILAEASEPGASVAVVARRHDMNANLLFTWRRAAGSAGLRVRQTDGAVTFVPAAVTADSGSAIPPEHPRVAGFMEIELVCGDRVLVGSDVDAAALARVIKVLSRR